MTEVLLIQSRLRCPSTLLSPILCPTTKQVLSCPKELRGYKEEAISGQIRKESIENEFLAPKLQRNPVSKNKKYEVFKSSLGSTQEMCVCGGGASVLCV